MRDVSDNFQITSSALLLLLLKSLFLKSLNFPADGVSIKCFHRKFHEFKKLQFPLNFLQGTNYNFLPIFLKGQISSQYSLGHQLHFSCNILKGKNYNFLAMFLILRGQTTISFQYSSRDKLYNLLLIFFKRQTTIPCNILQEQTILTGTV